VKKQCVCKWIAVWMAILLLIPFGLSGCTQGAGDGSKEVTVTVVHKDKSEKEFTYKTDCKHLGELLKTERLIQGENSVYGLYITTVDGEIADKSKEEWWCITAKGESVMTGVDITPIKDGDQYELTFMIGY